MSYQAAMNAELDKMRANGLSIDGDNAYKHDLLNAVTGALAYGKQRSAPPPAGHWLEPFYEMGKAEADERDAARSLPVGVPDGLFLGDALLMWNRRHDNPPIKVGYEYGVADAFLQIMGAPTVKAEQVDDLDTDRVAVCGCRIANTPKLGGNTVIFCAAHAAPSLPAAGSAVEEVEVVAIAEGEGCLPNRCWRGLVWAAGVDPMTVPAQSQLMTVAQHNRIVAELQRELKFEQFTHETCFQDLEKLRAALSAQQSAPERVSVPVELAFKLVRTYENAIIDAAHWTDMDGEVTQLRALLDSHGRGEA